MNLRKATLILLFIALNFTIMYCAQAENIYPSQQEINAMVRNDFSDYMQNLQEKLHTTWQPPDFMEEGHVQVHFALDRRGNVINSTIIESSGNDIYDESAIEALKNCSPFGDFPENSLKEFISIKYSFDTILIEEERMNGYYRLAKMNTKNNPQKALEYLNLALEQVGGEEASSFLYKRRADIKEILGDREGAKEDYKIYNLYTERANIKRIHLLKHLTETKQTPYLYHYLAFAYEQVNDYDNAIPAIDRAIDLAKDKTSLLLYKKHLIEKLNKI